MFLLLLLLAVVAYAPVAFMQASLKWDMVDCYLPWRHFVAESFAHGVFPLWNPYQSFGYPIHGDLRSVYYPEVLLVGLFHGGYGIHLLHGLFLFHLALAGTGMYLLAGHFTRRSDARMLVGAAYMLSGFFTGHGQEMSALIGGAWIPFILYHAIHVMRGDGRGGHPPKLAIVLFLQLTGGYQALSIMLLYQLAILFLVNTVQRWRAGERTALRSLILRMLPWGAVILASMAVLGVTYAGIAPYIGRFSGMALDQAQVNPFPPLALLSFLFPHASVANNAAFATDISMTNAYVGLLPLMAFIVGLVRRRTASEHVFLWFGLLCMLAAFGPHLPVREWLFDHAPLMDLFRMPSFFRYYAMLAILLLAAAELGRWLERPEEGLPKAQWGVALLGIPMVGLTLLAWSKRDGTEVLQHLQGLTHAWGDTSMPVHILAQAVFVVPLLLLLFLALLWTRRRTSRLGPVLAWFLLVEMVIAVRLNMPATAVQPVPAARIASVLDAQPRSFVLPDLRAPIMHHQDTDPAMWPLWRNTGIFAKQVSAYGFNSFTIDAYQRFESDRPELFEAARRGPVLFLSHALCPERRWRMYGAQPGELVVPDSVHAAWEGSGFRPAVGDTIIVERFEPGDVSAAVHLEHGAVLTLAQMDHPGWNVLVNGEAVPHAPGHLALLSIPLDKGRHEVTFRFAKPPVIRAYLLSYLLLTLFIGMALYHGIRERFGLGPRPAAGSATAISLGLVAIVTVAWTTRMGDAERRQADLSHMAKAIASLAEKKGPQAMCIDVDAPAMMDSMLKDLDGPTLFIRGAWPADLSRLHVWLDSLKEMGMPSLVHAGRGAMLSPDVEELILRVFPREEVLLERKGVRVARYGLDGQRDLIHRARLDLVHPEEGWPFDAHLAERDTVAARMPVLRIDPTRPGSPPFEVVFGALGSVPAERIVFSLDAIRSTAAADATMYIVIDRHNGEEWHLARRIAPYVPVQGEWDHVLLVGRPPFRPHPADRLKVFVWNEGSAPLYLDGLTLEAFAR